MKPRYSGGGGEILVSATNTGLGKGFRGKHSFFSIVPRISKEYMDSRFPLTSHISFSLPVIPATSDRYRYTSGLGLKDLTKSTVTMFLNTEAYGESSADFLIEFETMVLVPFEKTTHWILDLEPSFSRAGPTSGKIESESYAFIISSMPGSSSLT